MDIIFFLESEGSTGYCPYIKINQGSENHGKVYQIVIDLRILVRIVPIHKTNSVGSSMIAGNC